MRRLALTLFVLNEVRGLCFAGPILWAMWKARH